MRAKKFTLAALALTASSILLAPSANASGFIVVDPAFHVPPPAPVATPTVTPGITPIRPGDRTPRPTAPVLHGSVSTGLSLDKQEITVDIDNHVAKTYIKQTFRNDTDRNLAGTYLFPLPQDATFSSFSLHIDGKAIEGQILAAAEARAQYEQIVRSMVDPGLLEYADYKTVRCRIFPIPAHGTKTVELEYTQLVKADGGMFKYKFPLKSAQCEAVDETAINLKLKSKEELRTIWSPSHIIKTDRKDGHLAIVSFNDKEANSVNEKDFSIYYTVSDKDLSASLLSHKKSDEDGYFLMTLNPPLTAKDVIAKDIVLIADTSGSMSGEKMDQCKKALKYVVESLHPTDRFSLVRFSTDAEPFQSKLIDASNEHKNNAKVFIDDLAARGGTNIGDAMSSALEILNTNDHPDRPAYLVLMTDGQPTVGITEMNDLIKSVKPKRDIRVFDFGVGYDVNTKLLNKLAEEHHGSSQYVEPDEDLEITLSHFYTKIASPVLSDVKIAYDGVDVKDVYPKSVKDLFAGTPVMLLGRYKTGSAAKIKLTGMVNGTAKSFDFPMTFAESEAGSSYLPRMWAMRRIGYLTDVAQANDDNQEVVDEIVELSKRYGIISAYTSFLVTDPSENRRLPNPVRPMPATRLDSFVTGSRELGAARFNFAPSSAAFSGRSSTGHSSAMPGAWSGVASGGGGAGTPAWFSFSNKQRQVIGGLSGATNGTIASGLPATNWGKSVHGPGDNHYSVNGKLQVVDDRPTVRDSRRSMMVKDYRHATASALPPPAVPGAPDGNMIYGDEGVAMDRAEESKVAFKKALAKAEPAGEKAVLVQKTLNDLRSTDALAKAGSTGGVKIIGDKTFYFLNGFWVDSSFEKVQDPKPDEIEFGSKQYFELVKTESGITQYLGAGQQVIVVFKGKCYKIVAPANTNNVG